MRALAFLLVVLLLACGKNSKKEGDDDVPLAITNAPACPPGLTYMHRVAVRIESGANVNQFVFNDPMFAPSTWAGREATVKVGLCRGEDNCKEPSWLKSETKKIEGNQQGLRVELPTGLELLCEGGTTAKN